LAFHDAAVERAFWASRSMRTYLMLTDLAAVVWTVSNNGALVLSLFKESFASQPRLVSVMTVWIAAIVAAQVASCGLLLASRERYFALRPRILLILRALRLGCWGHVALHPPMAVNPSSTLLRALLIDTGALFSFEISLMLPLPFHQQSLFLLATVPCGVLTSLHKAASTIRAVPGLAEQACRVYGAARQLSLLNPLALLSSGLAAGGADPSCPPHAPEAVAIGTYVLLGLVAPLVVPWLIEMRYRCVFAGSFAPLEPAGPEAVRWPPMRRASAAALALLLAAVCAVTLIVPLAEHAL